jgi:uncharacterized protein with HEPN domain
MKRDARAFLIDIVDAAEAILNAIHGVSLDDYCNSRLIRSAVEREFTIIGEALSNLSRVEPEWFTRIERGGC